MIRTLDFIFALFGLVIAMPFLIVLYIIGLFDTGSPIFMQERVGRHKKPFTLIKFRRLFFAREEHLPLILITQLVYSKKKNKIFNVLNLNEAESVRFVLGKPRGFKPESLDEEERFWGAKGRLNYLFETLESFDTERKVSRKTFRKKSTELSVESHTEWQFDFF